jgi:hypothetical protein
MSAVASELTALASTTVVDIYKRSLCKEATDAHYVRAAKIFTAAWGVLAVLFATFASLLDNLIQAVNILGSLFTAQHAFARRRNQRGLQPDHRRVCPLRVVHRRWRADDCLRRGRGHDRARAQHDHHWTVRRHQGGQRGLRSLR